MTPPRWAEWILEVSLPRGLTRDSILGDLEEDFAERSAEIGEGAARRWYGSQAIGIALRAGLPARIRQIVPSFGQTTMILETFRSALKSVRRAPGFAVLTTTILALGIGATTTVFSLVDGVLIRPLPYPDSDRIVTLSTERDGRSLARVSEPEFADLARDLPAYEAVAAVEWRHLALGSATELERIPTHAVTASFPRVLGISPEHGRWFAPDEDAPGAPLVVVLSHGTAVRLFGQAADAVTREVSLEEESYTVIGVMPAGFTFRSPDIQAWIPLALDPVTPFGRNNQYLEAIARVGTGSSIDAATEQLDGLSATLTRAHPDFYPTPIRFTHELLKTRLVGDARAALLMLLGAVGGLLLVSGSNAAGLFLARGEHRKADLAVRSALGASRRRILGQLWLESVVIAGLAGTIGLGIAQAVVTWIVRVGAVSVPRLETVGVDARVALFGLLLAIVTGAVFGLLPAVQTTRTSIQSVITSGGRGGVGSRRANRFRRALVGGQIALATILMLGASLMLRSFESLRSTDLGFDPSGAVIIPVQPTEVRVPRNAPAVAFYQRLEARLADHPAVASVGAARRVPLRDGHDRLSIQIESNPVSLLAEAPAAGIQWATPGYFEAARLSTTRGRAFSTEDGTDAPLVAVVSQGLADELWPGADALGQRVRMWPEDSPWMEVVGVVENVRRNGPQSDAPTMLYIPHAQGLHSGYLSPNALSLIVRTSGDPSIVADELRSIVAAEAPGVPMGTVVTGGDLVGGVLDRDRFVVQLLSAFSLVALLLGAVGVYGVISHAVRARTRELGLRVAMGASSDQIARGVLSEGLRVGIIGASGGLVAGLLLALQLERAVLHVDALDPISIGVVVPTLLLAVAAATGLPALRAARLDPTKALGEHP
ncbi:MAG: ADOP family duplicated permease [Gemmatimonadota bacterium]